LSLSPSSRLFLRSFRILSKSCTLLHTH
jgi:hypothetical protein